MQRREFLNLIAIAAAAGAALDSKGLLAATPSAVDKFYDLPSFGNVHFLHMTDCHAQLKPIYFREPRVNLGFGSALNQPPHLVGEHLLKAFNIRRGGREAYAFSHVEFEAGAKAYGKVGGFAHLATLVKQLKASRPSALLLDGGDTWQGSATALWTDGQDMVDACLALGVDVMTGHWEFTLGAKRVQEIVEKDFKGKVDFLAQNIKTADFEDLVFKPYTMKEMNSVPVAIIGQAFPYTPIANPRYLTPDWTFGIREEDMQKTVDDARAKGAKVVVLLSHNGMDVDLKLASRVRGIDAILGGHTHDGVPGAIPVKNPGGTTLVTNAGSNSKFLGVLDFEVKEGAVKDFRYKLLPIFSNLIPADPAMNALITKIRAPFEADLGERLATTDAMLYRRGNFNGSFDQLILDALMESKNTEIAFSPGFRWGTTLLSGEVITREHLMDQTAISYPYVTVNDMTGEMIKTVLEDVADNLFNPDPYYQQGGDMVRVGGLQYTIDPLATQGRRISDMRLKGVLIEASKTYKVAGWAPVSEAARDAAVANKNEAIWHVVEAWLKAKKRVTARRLNTPRILNAAGNRGMA